MSTIRSIVCLQCDHVLPADDIWVNACPSCGGVWLDARYDYEAVAAIWQNGLLGRETTLWRYAELLPLERLYPELSLSEGSTPLTRLYPYEALYNHSPIYIKDERANPTNSFKDRQAALSVQAMKQRGITECVLASTGNAAVAYAAYCARAGIKLWLFLTSLVPNEKMREAAMYGCEVVKVSGTYDETKKVAAEFAQRKGLYFDRGARSVPGKESMKTLAYEIAEQIGTREGTAPFIAPDWYIQAVSGGIGPLGVWKGFSELYYMGLTDRIPKLAIVQAAGCSPMVQAFHDNQESATPVVPQTLITVLATGDPGYAYTLLRQAILTSGGTMLAVPDGETFTAMRRIASRGGMSVEPATAVAFAGLERLLQDGTIKEGERVALNASGHTFPAESHILGDQFERYILDLKVHTESVPQHEGLGAALKNLDEQVTTIVIIDDNPNDRRLIRRLLQSRRRYRIYEAKDGQEALTVIRERQPDLIITDLTMPNLDGFGVLEWLKNQPGIAHIPVIVLSAKALTSEDRRLLERHSAGIYQKGGFDTQGLVQQVVNLLGHDSAEVLSTSVDKRENAPAHVPVSELDTEADNVAHTLVVIDDNPHDLRLARRILGEEAYTVIEASNGRDGLKAIYNFHPDLIVLDWLLPDMSGEDVIEALQRDPNLREIPVIVYSAREFTAEERTRFGSGIRQIINKGENDRRDLLNMVKGELE